MNTLSANSYTEEVYPGDKLILIVSRSIFFQELLCVFLEKETCAKCHGFHTVADAVQEFKTDSSKIALLLLDCCKMNPDKVMSHLKECGGEFLTNCFPALMNVEADLGFESISIKEGAKGIFYENDSLENLLKGIKAIFSGEFWVSKNVIAELLMKGMKGLSSDHQGVEKSSILTLREKEILEIIAMGSSNEETASNLCISPNTVKTHLYNIFKKIGVPNRLQAALWAVKNL